MKNIIKISCLFVVLFCLSCNHINRKYEHNKIPKLLRGTDYTIFKVKNDIIYEVLDSLYLMTPNKISRNMVFELYFDTSNCNTNQLELVFNFILMPMYHYLSKDILKLYERIGDGGFVYKDIAILVHHSSNEKFNDYFINTKKIKPLYFRFGVGTEYYMEEPYKQNKELIPLHCYFRVKLIDNKISEITTNCDSVSFRDRFELFKLYGYKEDDAD